MNKKNKSQKNRMTAINAVAKEEYKQYNNSKTGKTIKILIIIFLIIIAIVFVIVSGVFNISEIIVENNQNVSTDQIISFSGIQKGTNIFAISNGDVKNKIKENSYIEDIQMKRCLPNKIKLIVTERKIDYALQLASSFVYIDKNGYVIEVSNNLPTVPIIVGFKTDLSNIKPKDRVDNEDLEKMNIVEKILNVAHNNEVDNLITKVDISNSKNYAIYLETEGKIAYLGNGKELNTRFLYIKAILKEQTGKAGEIFADVDLNSEYVYFRENT